MRPHYRNTRGAEEVETPELPSGPFDMVVLDPPWSYGKGGGAGTVMTQYPTMTVTALCDLPVGSLLAPRACVGLWVTNPKLPAGFRLLHAWGLEYKTTLTWVKTTKVGAVNRGGLGWFFRGATEHLLFATQGGFRIPAALRQPNVILEPRTRHSAKPAGMYNLLREVSPGMRRLDMFSRSTHEGFETWGHEAPEQHRDD